MAKFARRTHCEHGHEFTAENMIFKNGNRRRCRICKNEQERDRKRELRDTTKNKNEQVLDGVAYGTMRTAHRQMCGLTLALRKTGGSDNGSR